MSMTHYMELLATNQPWNLIMFMAIPVILAETVAITELFILFGKIEKGGIRTLNKTAGIIGGIYFSFVFAYLMKNAAIPLTVTGGWRGIADVVAVGFYLFGIIPLGGMALLELGLIFKNRKPENKMFIHAIFVALFLVTAHVAMIAGMLNPEVTGWNKQKVQAVQTTESHEMDMK